MKNVVLTSVISTLLFGNALAEDAKVESAHIASPNQYELLLENEVVTVLKMTLKPGEQDNWHKHNAETVYFEKGGKATITTSEKDMTLEIPDGYVMWHDQWEHQVKNVGDTTITAIIVEKQ
ncbi:MULTISPECIES: cupin domain-containing protein [Pseudoalteromonas]|uniref:Cupin 2 conserved barrel domain-containing protein n=1 Tax=Pseudoalteromonas amylolytica TaxID=1859457 RepID=A0A1S1MPT7_9GAMM|nr:MULTISPECIES: hypothetical protein [Pseudoalteromonas]OHU84232.1 hypothetical protein BFC16_00860 [Pseudoalteromonas sp. JW3]OHU87227.1 hypothetical protein BET10_01075 [Pseudoalteromonas amylolytica]